MRGAGGSSGGIGQFLVGIMMMCGGFYMLLNAIMIRSSFSLGMGLYHFGGRGIDQGFGVTTGMIMIPFIFGIGIIFYNSKNWIGWILAVGSIGAFIFGVISSIRFEFRSMSSFDLIVMLVLAFGGTGILLRSLRSAD